MLNGKQLSHVIADRAERKKEVRAEAQGMLFSSREAELEHLAERARATLFLPLADLDGEIARSRERRRGRR